jgi:hypothetical protein
VGKRFSVGSTRLLGTQEDVSQIRSTVAARKKIGSVHVSDIRWLSPTLVVAAGTDGPYQVFWVVGKKSGRWETLMEYNRHPRSTKRSSQPLAVAMFSFQMTLRSNLAAALALASGG